MCNCKHSRCLKKFCECWAEKKVCTSSCKCENCGNIAGTDDYNKAISKYKESTIHCTCKKSKCIKKYCMCYLNGQKCSEKCRCIECKNISESLFDELPIIPKIVIGKETVTHKRNINSTLRISKTKRHKIDSNTIKIDDLNKSWLYPDWDLSLSMWLRMSKFFY